MALTSSATHSSASWDSSPLPRLREVASPHVVAIWTVISGGVLQVIDAIVEGWLADLCATYQSTFRTSSGTSPGSAYHAGARQMPPQTAMIQRGGRGVAHAAGTLPSVHVESYQEPRPAQTTASPGR